MKTTVKKWGNSAVVRIPASVMEAMHPGGVQGQDEPDDLLSADGADQELSV